MPQHHEEDFERAGFIPPLTEVQTSTVVDPLLRRSTVEKVTAQSSSTLMRRVHDGSFPVPVIVSVDRNGEPSVYAWRQSEVVDWILDRPRADFGKPARTGRP